MFAGSNWDAEDYDDWTVIQRDLKVNGGLIPAREEEVVRFVIKRLVHYKLCSKH